MATREGKLLFTAEDRTAAAFSSIDRRITGVSRTVASANSLLKSAIGTAPVAALAAAAKAAIDHADAIGDQAKQVGLTTKAYQELSYAAKQLDVDQGQLDAALGRFHRRLGEARMGSKAAAEDFRRLGLDPRQFRTTDEAFAAVTKRLGAVKDEFARGALQANLFGKEVGPTLTNFVTTSADAVERLRREAHDLGAVMSDETIQKADEASNKLAALAHVTKTQVTVGLVELAPVLTLAGEGFVTLAKLVAGGVRELQDFADGMSETLAFGIQVDEEIRSKNDRRRREREAKAFAESAQGEKFRSTFEAQFGKNMAGAKIKDGRVRVGPEPPPVIPEDPEEVRKRAEKDRERQDDLLGRMEEYDRENDERIADSRQKERDQIEQTLITYSDEGAALAKLRTDRALLDKALEKNYISAEKHAEAVKNIEKAERELVEKKQMTVFSEQAARNIQSITADLFAAAMAGQNMGDAIVGSLRRIAAELAAQAALDAIFGVMANSNIGWVKAIGVKGQAAQQRASGGPVGANDPYIVGERGPELFVPRSSGYIVPNHKMGSAPSSTVVNITQNVDARNADAAAASRILAGVAQANAELERRIYENLRRGTAPT